MGSRLMGVVREQVFAYMFGASKLSDVFIAAFRIPNLLRDLFAEGALSTAFTTTFTKTWAKEGPDASWRLAQIVLSTLILILELSVSSASPSRPLSSTSPATVFT